MNAETKDDLIFFVSLAVIVLIPVIFGILTYNPEKEYERKINITNNYRNLCESAGFIFEMEGSLEKEEIKESNNITFGLEDEILLKCYDLRNGVKVYYDLNKMEKIK
ncbi:MAG: hypothetical protein WC758_08060 [Candidatus Woesearchaeota archaeon]|jgi:hypothetical protein